MKKKVLLISIEAAVSASASVRASQQIGKSPQSLVNIGIPSKNSKAIAIINYIYFELFGVA